MSSFFEYYFKDYDFSKRETAVCCPFPHRTESGVEYMETRPSAHINIDKGLSEVSFIAELYKCSYESAVKISKLFQTREDIFTWRELKLTEDIKQLCKSLGISE